MASSGSAVQECLICVRAGGSSKGVLWSCDTCSGTPIYCEFHMTATHQYHPTTVTHSRKPNGNNGDSKSSVGSTSGSSVGLTAEDPLSNIRRTTLSVMNGTTEHVSIDNERLNEELKLHPDLYREKALPSWEHNYHYADGTDLTAQYVFVLDALNFCFWPLANYEYEQLAGSLKATLVSDKTAFNAERLMTLTPSTLSNWLQPTAEFLPKGESKQKVWSIPLVEERARLLREVGRSLHLHFSGSAANMVRAAKGSAATLVELITAHFPGFRDHAIYRGQQIFFYKRAQILVGDIWGAYGGRGLGAFSDIDRLTSFADYRLPQLLRQIGIMKYSAEVSRRVDAREEIPAGSEIEVQIRAATVVVVERMIAQLRDVHGVSLLPAQLDWLLWERGEALLPTLLPHHRTLTLYY